MPENESSKPRPSSRHSTAEYLLFCAYQTANFYLYSLLLVQMLTTKEAAIVWSVFPVLVFAQFCIWKWRWGFIVFVLSIFIGENLAMYLALGSSELFTWAELFSKDSLMALVGKSLWSLVLYGPSWFLDWRAGSLRLGV